MITINKGILTIETDYDNGNRKSVIFNPVNGTVWLAKADLSNLFDIKQRIIDCCIENILNTNILDMEKTCRYHTIVNTSRNKVKYEPYELNLEFIIAQAFRIDSENAQVLRRWIVEQLVNPKLIDLPASISRQQHEWN
ncbi:hypothetical protein [Dysgonomonas sp. 511]|uniref:hypothetical protein n=1 Tax=Dysgonomonas sp. 511 TaxID=2302930 RepID=UPI001C870D5E|nr:hypothetical protein [Dysgonomonas sp. 511]